MKSIATLTTEDLAGKHVIVRAGLDVPLDAQGNVADLYRVNRAAETLRFLVDRGAKVVVLSHIGRKPEETNEPVARALNAIVPVFYVPDLLGAPAHQAVSAMTAGQILLLENLRTDPRETANDEGFAKELASLGDIYVNDAFSAAHRMHASIVGVPKYLPHYAGLLLCDEVDHLSHARTPQAPSFAILGGAKFETKAPLIKTLLETYDHLFITGALANDVYAARGLSVGTSLISEELPTAEVLNHPHCLVPVDVTVERADGQAIVKKPSEVLPDERIVDVGPDSLALIAPYIVDAKSVLWNGPTGLYEHGFTHWTQSIAEIIGKTAATKVIGGGDTIAAIQESGVDMSTLGFLSTGGGAMLEYLRDGTLPGIEALN